MINDQEQPTIKAQSLAEDRYGFTVGFISKFFILEQFTSWKIL
jgi:hypothetical protein